MIPIKIRNGIATNLESGMLAMCENTFADAAIIPGIPKPMNVEMMNQ